MIKKLIALCLTAALLLSMLAACDIPFFDGGATLFIYMCGSNLETKQGQASKNIDELLSADTGDLNIVIQTGGAKQWRGHDIDDRAAQRYEIKDGELVLLDTLEQLNMGDAQTLTDFLQWGQENYKTSRNMLVLWDHGGGAAKGVCFDENYGFDGLTLTELRSALDSARLKHKFELIGFDACLMASIETAVAVKDYADYMVASEEIEPSGGWDFKVLAEAYAAGTEPIEVGKAVCDSYMAKCEKNGNEKLSTLSVFDLSYTDKMLEQFNFAVELIQAAMADKELSSEIIHALKSVVKFGGGSSYLGSANMIDLIDVFNHTPNLTTDILPEPEYDDMTGIWEAVYTFVPYRAVNEYRSVCGVSFYYPISYDKNEIDSYIDLGLIEPYNQFLKAFYQNIPDTTVAFTDKGSIGGDGAFTVSFTPDSVYYLNSVDYILMSTDKDGVRHTLCSDNDVTVDQETMEYRSNFKGTTLALDGHKMFSATLIRVEGGYVEYNTPVIVNGKRTNLVYDFIYNWDDEINGGYYLIYGIWDSYDESGLPSNNVLPIKQGDKVKVLTETKTVNGRSTEVFSDEFTIGENGGQITEIPLDGKEYQYVYVASDLFGNTFFSDMATFEMTVSYEELLENPLPDNTYAAKVTGIEPYTP